MTMGGEGVAAHLDSIYAHSVDGSVERGELLSAHLEGVAALAARFGARFGAGEAARAAGLLHDIGKASEAFQRYIRHKGPSPDHSTAGAREAERLFPGPAGRLVACAVAGHHAGLADGTSLAARLTRELPPYDRWRDLAPGLPADIMPRFSGKCANLGYSLAFLGRMIFSCLIDADRLATERFYGERERGGHASLATLRDRLDGYLAALMAGARADSINDLRAEILARARAKAARPPGLFTMTVPTGGGKTLASLAFALDHAVAHGLDRVVYVIPYTSIIEQTAEIFRTALGDHDGNAPDVLEHHGNVDFDRGETDADGRDGLAKLRRAAENWDVPVIVTTAVQFFESLHAARPSACRKLHNLARSVIVLDEAQTLPVPLLRPCLAAIDELARMYGTSIVLCTATQPALTIRDGFKRGLDIPAENELAPEPDRLYRELKRVEVLLAGVKTDAEIAARFGEAERMLCIVNSRSHAQALFELIQGLPGARHLTTLMCPAHRRAVLAEVRAALENQQPVRLVATSLIEAGVDVDFPEVWRAETGLDGVIQAAGRCNREGKSRSGNVTVFASGDHKLPAMFRQQVDAMRAALKRYPDDPLGLDAVREYFRHLYWIKTDDALDAATIEGVRYPILPALSESIDLVTMLPTPPFERVAKAFRMIDDPGEPVIVRWTQADTVERLLDRLRLAPKPPGEVLRKLQQFTVSIPAAVRAAMLARGDIVLVAPDYGDRFVVLASDAYYDEHVGFLLDGRDQSFYL